MIYSVTKQTDKITETGVGQCPLCCAVFDTMHPQAAWSEINDRMLRICPTCASPN